MSQPERDDLQAALHDAADAAPPHAIDLDAVLRASRARRRARRTAIAGGAGAIAALLAIGGLVIGLQPGSHTATGGAPAAVESTESADAPPAGEASGPDAESATGSWLPAAADLHRCGEPPAAADAPTPALVVAVTPPAAVVRPGGTAVVSVTVTNAGDVRVEGELWDEPAVAVAKDGVVVSRSLPTGAPASEAIALDPGESATLTGTLAAMRCGPPDAAGSNPSQGPLAPGAYELGVIVGFLPAGGEAVHLVSPFLPLTVG